MKITQSWFGYILVALLALTACGSDDSPTPPPPANNPPVINEVNLDPVVPTANTQTTVSAQISDDNGIISSILYYNLDGGAWTEVIMVSEEKVEVVFSAVIPGQAAGVVVGYYILVTDNSGETVAEPMDAPESFDSFTPIDGKPRL
jgi:hypothetical protein